MWGSAIHFGKVPNTPCSICARGVTLELSKTDEQGRAVHELCYVQATLAGLRRETEQTSFRHNAAIPAAVIPSVPKPDLEGSFWEAFEFVRW